ncbi:hypothetical protein AB0M02_19575 [Actinoplanes sp. NPDC051861]|uniref:hypothetical protein n=1 Tax=Actinoplanes sp. NPDC051861 TaxID=3155170 RepID=UPI00341DA9F3
MQQEVAQARLDERMIALRETVGNGFSDLSRLIGDLRTAIAESRAESREQVAAVRAELREEVSGLRAELEKLAAELEAEQQRNGERIGMLEAFRWKLAGAAAVLSVTAGGAGASLDRLFS